MNNTVTERKQFKVERIYEETRQQVEKQVRKLYKKADTLGVEKPVVDFSEPYFHTYSTGELNPENPFAKIEGDFQKFQIEVFDLTIKVPETLQFNGWKPIAFLDYSDQVYIQMDIDKDYDYDFEKSLENCNCEHCKTNRFRRKLWVLQNEESGEFKKVGSSCVAEFTGMSPTKFFKMFQFINKQLDEISNEDIMWGRSGKIRKPENYIAFEIDEVLTVAHNVIEIDGDFIKSEWDYNGYESFRINEGESTTDKVKEVLMQQHMSNEDYKYNPYYLPKGSVNNEVVDGIKYYVENVHEVKKVTEKRYNTKIGGHEEVEFDNEFDLNVKSILDKKRVRFFDVGIICYIPQLYNYYLKNKDKPESDHVGTIGQKEPMEVIVSYTKTIDTQFGLSTLYKMVDTEGNIITKFGTINERYIADESEIIKEGTKLKFNAQIKEHSEYNGKKETLIGRLSKFKK